MVPRERIEGAKLVPPGAQFRLSVADEATDVRPDHGNPKLVELQHPDDRPSQVLPVGEVVSKPVCCPPVVGKLLETSISSSPPAAANNIIHDIQLVEIANTWS